jgi:hypothetical protein
MKAVTRQTRFYETLHFLMGVLSPHRAAALHWRSAGPAYSQPQLAPSNSWSSSWAPSAGGETLGLFLFWSKKRVAGEEVNVRTVNVSTQKNYMHHACTNTAGEDKKVCPGLMNHSRSTPCACCAKETKQLQRQANKTKLTSFHLPRGGRWRSTRRDCWRHWLWQGRRHR